MLSFTLLLSCCSVIAALAEVEDTLNGVFEHAFSGFTYGDDCGDKCIDWTITYAQVSSHVVCYGHTLQLYAAAECGHGFECELNGCVA